MNKMVISMDRGLIQGVYAPDPFEADVREIDHMDEYDEERKQEYWRNQWLINHDCYTDITEAYTWNKETAVQLHRLDERERNRLIEQIGDSSNLSDISFWDGVLEAWGSLNRYIAALVFSKCDEERKQGEFLRAVLSPLKDAWEQQYEEWYCKLQEKENSEVL